MTSENATITNCGLRHREEVKVTQHQEDNKSKATISLFPSKMIVKLESTQSTTIEAEHPDTTQLDLRLITIAKFDRNLSPV